MHRDINSFAAFSFCVGDFLELEVMMKDGQPVEDGQRIATDLMAKLGIEENELISGAYMDLLLNKPVV